jgi:hypothetical protein
MTFGDSDKAIFGAGSDLQIYHDGSNSYTGIDVTGTVTADGLAVDGVSTLTSNSSADGILLNGRSDNIGQFTFRSNDGATNYSQFQSRSTEMFVKTLANIPMSFHTNNTKRLGIASNGDLSLYEDTGTTAKFFWDASAESLGIGTSSPSAPLHVFKSGGSTTSINVALTLDYESPTASLAGSGTAILFKGKSGGGNLAQYDQAMISTNNIGSNNSHGLSFFYKPNAATALTEGLTLDEEGNVGIGVTPLTKLHVLSGTDNNIAAGVSEVRFIGADKAITGEQANLVIQTNDDMAVNKGGSIGLGGRHTTSSTNGVNFAQISGRKENATSANFAGYLAFGTSDSASDIHERMRIDSSGNVGMRIDSSGNVGIGVVPSSWASNTFDALQLGVGIGVGNLTARVDGINAVGLGLNWYYGGGATNTYVASSYATNYVQEAGTHKWLHAASGTAGAALTFTESMRIDSSGNVGIGDSKFSRRFAVSSNSWNRFSLEHRPIRHSR